MILSIDFETCLIRPGLQAPPPVCLSRAWSDGAADLVPTSGLPEAWAGAIQHVLDGGTLVGHNIAYDAAVALTWLPDADVIAAYETGRVLDTMILERIAEIGRFTTRKVLSLDVCCAAYGVPIAKDQGVRLSYGSVWGLPLASYTPEQIAYAVGDSVATLQLFERQCERYVQCARVRLEDVALMTCKALWLQITRNRGLRTNPDKIDQLRRETALDVAELATFGREIGFLRDDGTRNMKAIKSAVSEAYAGAPPITPTGGVKTSRATLEESGDAILEIWAEYGENISTLSTIAGDTGKPTLATGAVEPIHTKFGIADTTRTTSSRPNVQNIRRREGLRECFEPRAGFCYIEVDHSGLEQVCLAQVIVTRLGRRTLADKLNAGVDTHAEIAAAIIGCSYDDVLARRAAGDKIVDNARQQGKVVNYGRAGFMGAKTLRFFAKQSYQIDLTLTDAERLIKVWEAVNPDGAAYLDWIKHLPEAAGLREMTIPGTEILRRGCTISAAANSHFQGLGAVVEAVTGWEMLRATRGAGALGRCHLVNFVHDSFHFESPPECADDALAEALEIMHTAPRSLLPDLQIRAESVKMWQWSKRAKSKPGGEIWGVAPNWY